jgi:transcriptional regulator with XRE-family HTH domain
MPAKQEGTASRGRNPGKSDPDKKPAASGKASRKPGSSLPEEEGSLISQVASLAAKAFKLAAMAGGVSIKVGRALIPSSAANTKLMQESGSYLKDVRELAGLTQAELAEALHQSDTSLLAAVEKGTATLSFELILRLAALLARHDPVPFIIRFTRTYDPEIWGILEKWGVGRLPLHFEREREFINIFRSHDAARKLTDKGFAHVLGFTRAAFEMALHFVSEQEHKEGRGSQKRKAKDTPQGK